MENITEKQLVKEWLTNNKLGSCELFRAKLTEEACISVKNKHFKKLMAYDYSSENMRLFYEICCYKCNGLTFKDK